MCPPDRRAPRNARTRTTRVAITPYLSPIGYRGRRTQSQQAVTLARAVVRDAGGCLTSGSGYGFGFRRARRRSELTDSTESRRVGDQPRPLGHLLRCDAAA